MQRYLKYVAMLICCLIYGDYYAQIITDRPSNTESSTTVGNGDLQIESGFLIQFQEEEAESVTQIVAPINSFRFGLTKGIELRVIGQFESQKTNELSVQGISDMQLGTKIQILKKEGCGTKVAFLSHLIIPTGSKDLTNQLFGTINKIIVSHALSNTLGLAYNVGYKYVGKGDGDLLYTLILGLRVNEKTSLFVEPYGQVSNLEEIELNFDVGLAYLIQDNLQFDFYFGSGVSHRMNFMSVGLSWLLPHKNVMDNN